VEPDVCGTLQRLVNWEASLDDLVNEAERSDHHPGPLMCLDVRAVRSVLERCITGGLPVSDLPRWAGAVHMLECVYVDEEDLDLLTQFLFEVSTPELFDPVTTSVCRRWLDRMS
jgi:hypothetical protein